MLTIDPTADSIIGIISNIVFIDFIFEFFMLILQLLSNVIMYIYSS